MTPTGSRKNQAAAGPSGPAAPQSPAALTDGGGDHARRETLTLITSRVGDAPVRKPFFLDGATDIVSACRQMAAAGVTDVLVRGGGTGAERLGIFTTTNLRDVLLMDRPPDAVALHEIAAFPAVTVERGAELFEAMILMLRHRVHRLVVCDRGQVAGVLRQLDLMGFLANHSHLIALEAAEAGSVPALKHAADQIAPLIAALHQDGMRVEVIARLVGELNRTVFRRLWELVAPADLRENSCLIVMGSEGRGEQIMRTDQDNGLILRDGMAPEAAAAATAAFTAALVDFGYPPCPGGIMASRPDWCRDVAGYRRAIGQWVHGDDPEGPMKLAIFMDALAVSGDADLLAGLRAHLARLMSDSDAYLARFAASVNSFAQDRSWWSRLPGMTGRGSAEVDIKKLGIFPIVQGTRALSLKYRVPDLSTTARLAALAQAGRITLAQARDLSDALHFLMGVKLDSNLRQIAEGRAPDNLIRLDTLGALDREGLKQALAIVRGFRDWITQHFRLQT